MKNLQPTRIYEETGKWVNIVFVWNPTYADDGSTPTTFKMYLDGQLVKVESWGQRNYTPNTQGTAMIGFNYTNYDGSIATDGKSTNGYMKYVHIWYSHRGEADLVCSWKFTDIQQRTYCY